MVSCSAPQKPPLGSSQPESSTPPVLRPVSLPDLSTMAAPVQAQLRDQYAAVTRVKDDLASSPADRAAAYGELGRLLLAAESFAAAEPCFFNAHELAPNEARWPYYLAHVYRLEGDSQEAASSFERTLQIRPDDVPALVWLGNSYLDQGRSSEAEPLFARALTLQPRLAAAQYGLGRTAAAKREYKQAIEHFEAALALDPRASSIHYALAAAYRSAGQPDKAEVHLRQRGAVEVAPPDPVMQELADVLRSSIAYERRGDRAVAAGDFGSAVTQFRKGLELAPDSLPLRQKLATTLSLTGDVPGAVQQLQEILRRSPTFPSAHYSLGVLLLSSGRDDLAIEQFSAAVHGDPTYVQARLQLAHALRRRAQFAQALREYTQAIEADPRLAEARFGEAVTLVHLKRYGEARDRLDASVRLHPERDEFGLALARLLAAAPDDRVRDGGRALTLAQAVVARRDTVDSHEVVAMALAETGQYDEAAKWQRDAIAAADRAGHHDAARTMADNLTLYTRRQPCRTPWREDPAWTEP